MEASELKTGNYVTIKGNKEYLKVEDIIASKNRVTLLSKDGNKIIECLDNIEPIELTEEIIKKGGYNTRHDTVIYKSEIDKYNKEGWPLPYNKNPFEYYFDVGYGRIKFYYGVFSFYPDNDHGSILFNYIHELQNILKLISIKRSNKKYGQEIIDNFDLWKQNK